MGRNNLWVWLVLALGVAGIRDVHAQAISFNGNVSTGNFTVTAGGCPNNGGPTWCELREAAPGVGETQIGYFLPGDAPISIARSNLGPGTYLYTLYVNEYDPVTYGQIQFVGDQRSVTVFGDSVSTQSLYGYEVRRGDLNNDGLQDLLVTRTSGGMSANGVIDSIVLQRASTGTFMSVVPTSGQLATALAWPLVPVEVSLVDIDMDGYVDIILNQVSSAISGAKDQLVISSGQVTVRSPKKVVNLDSTFDKFTTEVWNFNQDPSYFYTNAPIVYVPEEDLQYYCWFEYDPYEGQYYQYCDYVWVVVYVPYYDFTGYDERAVNLRDAFTAVVAGQLTPRLTPGSAGGQQANSAFHSVFGVDAFRGALGAGCSGGVYSYDSDDAVPCTNLDFFGEVLIRAVLVNYKAIDWRYLTSGEKTDASAAGLHILGVERVRVHHAAYKVLGAFPQSSQVMSPNGDVYIGPSNTIVAWSEDYSAGQATPESVLIHELTHVFQNRTRGCNVVCMYMKAIEAGGNYTYGPLDPNKSYYDYNIEQQAEMVQDRFLLRKNLQPWNSVANGGVGRAALEAVIPF